MADGTADDDATLAVWEAEDLQAFPDRVLGWLRAMDQPSGYQITRLEHCLQAATRAQRAGASEEMVVCALLHDIGDVLGPANHSEVAAAVLRPYVSERSYWIVRHHGLFQQYYDAHHDGGDRDAREIHRDHPHYDATVRFCEDFDQNSFDPDDDWEPLEVFEPMVRRILAPPRSPWT
ncbi:MAG: HD domain-containing protein [Nitriliruptor sp.]|nr:MAG: HD domain-containing protein [Nitriliruptor sp.]